MTDEKNEGFLARRTEARKTINALDKQAIEQSPERAGFFKSVYDGAKDDAAKIPWADMKPKEELVQWLEGKSGINLKALDIACGLGDHAELLALHGYETTAFDISPKAVDWAKKRFSNSKVHYTVGDIFKPPAGWIGAFDLVWECYTIQALHPDLRERSIAAIAGFVAPGGSLLVYTRQRENVHIDEGPPWPLSNREAAAFELLGFEKMFDKQFDVERTDKIIPHRLPNGEKSNA